MDIEFTLLIPEFILAGLGFFVLTVDMLMPRSWDSRRNGVTAASAALGLALVFVVALVRGWDEVEPRVLYDQLILVDRYALLFKALFTATGFAVVLMSVDYVGRKMRHPGEFYAMIVFAVLGATLMAETGELLTAFISIELLSFSLYVLVGLSRGDGRSAEASTKYILLGAISSGNHALRHQSAVRSARDDRVRANERGAFAGLRPDAGLGVRAVRRRLGFQAVDGPLPHVGPRRVRRSADARNSADCRHVEGGRFRPSRSGSSPWRA